MTTTPPHSLLPHTRHPNVRTVGLVVAIAYIGAVVTANWASTHWPAMVIGQFVVPAGTLWAGLTFTLRDMLHEAFGPRGVTAGIAIGAGVSWLLASPRIAVASVVAFAVSEILDSAVYAVLRHRSRLRAVVGSNIAGLLVDSLLFVPLAFGSLAAVPGQLVGKTAATVLTVSLLGLIRLRRPQAVRR
jgi:uncharacterized PurR-regulated membrane protein YhhQ (DUF165 family)